MLLYFVFQIAGLEKIYGEVLNLNLNYLLLAIALSFFQIFFRAWRWEYIIKIFNKSIGILSSMSYTCISLSFAFITPGRFGELVKVKYLSDKTDMSYKKSFLTVIIEKFFDTLVIILFILLGLSLMNGIYLESYLPLFLILYIIFLIFILLFLKRLTKYILKFLPKKYKEKSENISLNKKFSFRTFFISIIVWFLLCIQALLVLNSLGNSQIQFHLLIALVPLMALSSMIPISIGGIGTREIVAVYFFSLIGLPAEKSVTFSLLYTFVTIGFVAIIGAILYFKKKVRKITNV